MERMEYEGFFVEKEGAIATLVLNRPERLNACLLYTSPSPRD